MPRRERGVLNITVSFQQQAKDNPNLTEDSGPDQIICSNRIAAIVPHLHKHLAFAACKPCEMLDWSGLWPHVTGRQETLFVMAILTTHQPPD
jgi:hypothetical protein